jgi:hypothetical protein
VPVQWGYDEEHKSHALALRDYHGVFATSGRPAPKSVGYIKQQATGRCHGSDFVLDPGEGFWVCGSTGNQELVLMFVAGCGKGAAWGGSAIQPHSFVSSVGFSTVCKVASGADKCNGVFAVQAQACLEEAEDGQRCSSRRLPALKMQPLALMHSCCCDS